MLRWTAAGAVFAPDTLQVRVTSAYPGRVAAGAPAPTRGLSDEEVRDNLRFFTVQRRGPRSAAVTGLVLAGVDLPRRAGLASVLDDARGWGITRVVLHLGGGERQGLLASPLRDRIDQVALTVRSEADLAALRALSLRVPVSAIVLLDEATLPRLEALAEALAGARPSRVVFTWPFPGAGADLPVHADRAAAVLLRPVGRLEAAGVRCAIKGIPACRLGPLHDRAGPSANRYYVDADHQKDGALLFFPDVVRFARTDECRFCSAADRCDGPPEQWLRHRLTGPLRAFGG